MGFVKRILKPRWCRLHIICTHDIRLSWRDIQAGRLEKMHVQTLLPWRQRSLEADLALAGTCQRYLQIYLLVVCSAGEPLAGVDMAMLRALVSEVLRPTKQKNVAHLVENTVCFFEIPAFRPAGSVWHIFLEQFKQLHCS